MAGARMSTWDAVTWFHFPPQKANVPTLQPRSLLQISEGGKGNRGQMVRPPSGLALIDAWENNSINQSERA